MCVEDCTTDSHVVTGTDLQLACDLAALQAVAQGLMARAHAPVMRHHADINPNPAAFNLSPVKPHHTTSPPINLSRVNGLPPHSPFNETDTDLHVALGFSAGLDVSGTAAKPGGGALEAELAPPPVPPPAAPPPPPPFFTAVAGVASERRVPCKDKGISRSVLYVTYRMSKCVADPPSSCWDGGSPFFAPPFFPPAPCPPPPFAGPETKCHRDESKII